MIPSCVETDAVIETACICGIAGLAEVGDYCTIKSDTIVKKCTAAETLECTELPDNVCKVKTACYCGNTT